MEEEIREIIRLIDDYFGSHYSEDEQYTIAEFIQNNYFQIRQIMREEDN